MAWLKRRWLCVRGRWPDGTRNHERQIVIVGWIMISVITLAALVILAVL